MTHLETDILFETESKVVTIQTTRLVYNDALKFVKSMNSQFSKLRKRKQEST